MPQRFIANTGIKAIDKIMEGSQGRATTYVIIEKITTCGDAKAIFPHYVEYVSRYYTAPYKTNAALTKFAADNMTYVLRSFGEEKRAIWLPLLRNARQKLKANADAGNGIEIRGH